MRGTHACTNACIFLNVCREGEKEICYRSIDEGRKFRTYFFFLNFFEIFSFFLFPSFFSPNFIKIRGFKLGRSNADSMDSRRLLVARVCRCSCPCICLRNDCSAFCTPFLLRCNTDCHCHNWRLVPGIRIDYREHSSLEGNKTLWNVLRRVRVRGEERIGKRKTSFCR